MTIGGCHRAVYQANDDEAFIKYRYMENKLNIWHVSCFNLGKYSFVTFPVSNQIECYIFLTNEKKKNVIRLCCRSISDELLINI